MSCAGSGSPTRDDLLNPTSPAAASQTTFDLDFLILQQALHVSNIKIHVHEQLEQNPPNYSRRGHLFLVHLRKFNLESHIDGTPAADDKIWHHLDNTILSWMYACINPDIFTLVMQPNTIARSFRIALKDLFRDNQEARAIQLESEFRGLRQEETDLSRPIRIGIVALLNSSDVGYPGSEEGGGRRWGDQRREGGGGRRSGDAVHGFHPWSVKGNQRSDSSPFDWRKENITQAE